MKAHRVLVASVGLGFFAMKDCLDHRLPLDGVGGDIRRPPIRVRVRVRVRVGVRVTTGR